MLNSGVRVISPAMYLTLSIPVKLELLPAVKIVARFSEVSLPAQSTTFR